jgi:outer membrane protein assembly factor BamB
MTYLSLFMPRTLISALVWSSMVMPAFTADWPNWRGPTLDGASGETAVPEKLDASTQVWAVDLPGPSSGTPVVMGERIFLPTIDTATANLSALCLERTTGKVLWSEVVAPSLPGNARNNLASPSATTDGTHVIYLYGSGDIAAFTVEGKKLWARNLQKEFGKFEIQWLYGSSPLLQSKRVFVQVFQNDSKMAPGATTSSFLLAIDPATGKDLWKHMRQTSAKGESQEAYSTPIIYTANGHEELAVFGGDLVSAHDPATGKELWRSDGYNDKHSSNWRNIPGCVLVDGNVVSITARGGRTFAVKPGGMGDVTATNVVWNTTELTSDVCMPLFYQGKMYVLDGDKKSFRCADPKTGTILWQGKIPAKGVMRASPTGGGGRIYTMDESGQVFVLAADEFKILGNYTLGAGGTARSTVVLTHGMVLVRTAEKLFAFGNK